MGHSTQRILSFWGNFLFSFFFMSTYKEKSCVTSITRISNSTDRSNYTQPTQTQFLISEECAPKTHVYSNMLATGDAYSPYVWNVCMYHKRTLRNMHINTLESRSINICFYHFFLCFFRHKIWLNARHL